MDGALGRGHGERGTWEQGDGWRHPSARALAPLLSARPRSRGSEEAQQGAAQEISGPRGAAASRSARTSTSTGRGGATRTPGKGEGGKSAAGGPRAQRRVGDAGTTGRKGGGKKGSGYASEGTGSLARASRAKSRGGGAGWRLNGQASDGEGLASGRFVRSPSPAPSPAAAPRSHSLQQPLGLLRQRSAQGTAENGEGGSGRLGQDELSALPEKAATDAAADAGAGATRSDQSREGWSGRERPGRTGGITVGDSPAERSTGEGADIRRGPGDSPAWANRGAQSGGTRQARAEEGGQESKGPVARARSSRPQAKRGSPASNASASSRTRRPGTQRGREAQRSRATDGEVEAISGLAPKSEHNAAPARGSASSAVQAFAQRLSTFLSRAAVPSSGLGDTGGQSSGRINPEEEHRGRRRGRMVPGLFACIASVADEGDLDGVRAAGALGRSFSRSLSSWGSNSSRRNTQAQGEDVPARAAGTGSSLRRGASGSASASGFSSWRNTKERDINASLVAASVGMNHARSMEFPRKAKAFAPRSMEFPRKEPSLESGVEIPRRSTAVTYSTPPSVGAVRASEGEDKVNGEEAFDGREGGEGSGEGNGEVSDEEEGGAGGPVRGEQVRGSRGVNEGSWGRAGDEEAQGSSDDSEGQSREEAQGGASRGPGGGMRSDEEPASVGASKRPWGQAPLGAMDYSSVVPTQVDDTVLWDFTRETEGLSMGDVGSTAGLCAPPRALPLPLQDPPSAREQRSAGAGEDGVGAGGRHRRGDSATDSDSEPDAEAYGWGSWLSKGVPDLSSEKDPFHAHSQGRSHQEGEYQPQQQEEHQHHPQQQHHHQQYHQQQQYQGQHQPQRQEQHHRQQNMASPAFHIVSPEELSLRSSWLGAVPRGSIQGHGVSPGGRSTGSGDAVLASTAARALSARGGWEASPGAASEGGEQRRSFSFQRADADLLRGLPPLSLPHPAGQERSGQLGHRADTAVSALPLPHLHQAGEEPREQLSDSSVTEEGAPAPPGGRIMWVSGGSRRSAPVHSAPALSTGGGDPSEGGHGERGETLGVGAGTGGTVGRSQAVATEREQVDAGGAQDNAWRIDLSPTAARSTSASAGTRAAWEQAENNASASASASTGASASTQAAWEDAAGAGREQRAGAPAHPLSRKGSPQLHPRAILARRSAGEDSDASSPCSSTAGEGLGYSDGGGAATGGRRALSFSRPRKTPLGNPTTPPLAQDRDRDRDRDKELLGVNGLASSPMGSHPGLPNSRSGSSSLRGKGRHRRSQSGEGLLAGRPPAAPAAKDVLTHSSAAKGRHLRSASISAVPLSLADTSPMASASLGAGEGAGARAGAGGPRLRSRLAAALFSETHSGAKGSVPSQSRGDEGEDADSDTPPALRPSRSLARLDIGKGLRWGKAWMRRNGSVGKGAASETNQGEEGEEEEEEEEEGKDEERDGEGGRGEKGALEMPHVSAGVGGLSGTGSGKVSLGREFALALQQQLQEGGAASDLGPLASTLSAQATRQDTLASLEIPQRVFAVSSARQDAQGAAPFDLGSGSTFLASQAETGSESPLPRDAQGHCSLAVRPGSGGLPMRRQWQGGSGSRAVSRKASLADSEEVLISLWGEEGGGSPSAEGKETGLGPSEGGGSGTKKSGSHGRGDGETERERRSRILAGLKQRWKDTTGGAYGDLTLNPAQGRPPRPQGGRKHRGATTSSKVVRAKALRRAQLEATVAKEGHKRHLSFSEVSPSLPAPDAAAPGAKSRHPLERGTGKDARGSRIPSPMLQGGAGGAAGIAGGAAEPQLRRSRTMVMVDTRPGSGDWALPQHLGTPGQGGGLRHASTVIGAAGLAMGVDAWEPSPRGLGGLRTRDWEEEEGEEGEQEGEYEGDEEEEEEEEEEDDEYAGEEGEEEFPDLRRAHTSAGLLRSPPNKTNWVHPSDTLPSGERPLGHSSSDKQHSYSSEHEDKAGGQGKVRFYSFQRHIQQVAQAEASSSAHQQPPPLPPLSHRQSASSGKRPTGLAIGSGVGMSRTALSDGRGVGQSPRGGEGGQVAYASKRVHARHGQIAHSAPSGQHVEMQGGGGGWSEDEEMRRWRRCAPGMQSEDEDVRSFQQSLARMSNGELPLPQSFLRLPQPVQGTVREVEGYSIPLAGSANSLAGMERRVSGARSAGGSTEEEGTHGGLRRGLTDVGGGDEEEGMGLKRRIREYMLPLGDEEWGGAGALGISHRVSWRNWRERRGSNRNSAEGGFDGASAAEPKSLARALLGSRAVHLSPSEDRDRGEREGTGQGGGRVERRSSGSGSVYDDRDDSLLRTPSEDLEIAASMPLMPGPRDRFKSISFEDRLVEEEEEDAEDAALAVMREGGMSSTLMRHGNQKLSRLNAKSRQEYTPPEDKSRAHPGYAGHGFRPETQDPEWEGGEVMQGMNRTRSFHDRCKRVQGGMLDISEFLPSAGLR